MTNPTTTIPSSTSVPPNIAALKNKTLEQIVTKWKGDLDIYSKEFHRLAVEISNRDMIILENGYQVKYLLIIKIQTMYEQNIHT